MNKYANLWPESPWIKYLLALFYISNGKIEGSLRLHKELFLVSRGIPELLEDDNYGPHNYGPYSEEIDEDVLSLLEVEGLIKITDADSSSTIYLLTEEGKVAAKEAFLDFDENTQSSFKRVFDLLSGLTSDEILFLVYTMYPDMAVYSTVVERILKNKVKIAKSLLRKNKLSLKRLAELAQVDEKVISEG